MTYSWHAPNRADSERYSPEDVFAAGIRNHHIANTAYPIAHSRTWKPYKVGRGRYTDVVSESFSGIDQLCLYAHIPFCEKRCYFCEYTVVAGAEPDLSREYMNWMRQELALYRDLLETRDRTLVGFDIGGGTPSYVDADCIAELIEDVGSSFRLLPGLEISIETTPQIAANDRAKIQAYKLMGIDRISMGVQVVQPDLLRILNRDTNGVEHHRSAVENIRDAGFKKFNIDLMYGFADQSLESWQATLEHTISLEPEYITLYRMRYKLTRVSHQASRVTLEQVRPLSALAKQVLSDSGYCANPGKNTYSRISDDPGTSDYLHTRVVHGTPYLGIGLGAQSLTHSSVSYNDGSAGKNLSPYQRSVEAGNLPIQDLYDLPAVHMMGKMCAVSFYYGEVNLQKFCEKFGVSFEDAYSEEVEFVLRNGFMEYTGRGLSLTSQGARHFNGIIALFYAPSVKGYLMSRNADEQVDFVRNQQLAERVAQRQEAAQ